MVKSDGGDFMIVPASYQEEESGENSPLYVLGEVKNNIWKLLKTLPNAVSVSVFMKGYEGYYGYLNMEGIHCKDMVEMCKLMPDLCCLTWSEKGNEFLVSEAVTKLGCDLAADLAIVNVTNTEAADSARIVMNIRRVLVHSPGSVRLDDFYQKYLEIVGANVDTEMLGFSSLASLLRLLDPEMFQVVGTGPDTLVKLSTAIVISQPETSVINLHRESHLHPGWGRIVGVSSPGRMYLQMESMIDKVKMIEEEMEKFYTNKKAGLCIVPENVVVGLAVAALNPGLSWSRGRLVSIRQDGFVECHFVDHGHSALVSVGDLFHLDGGFGDLPGQAVRVRLAGLEVVGGGNHWPRVVGETLRDILSVRKGRVWVQTEGVDHSDIGLSNMKSVSQALVHSGLAVFETLPCVTVECREVGPDATVRTLQRLILSSLGRIRRKERLYLGQS